MNNPYILEICAYSVEGAIAANKGGANRIELCDNLPEGGTTPSAATIELARSNVSIDMNVIIRPRGGDFCYTDIEFDTMRRDIEIAKSLDVNGVVFGILLDDGSIDVDRTRSLVELARPMNVTFHRAFDMAKEPIMALDQVIETGADRILTSGQQNSAHKGIELLKELVSIANEKIIIMPGSGINDLNILEIASATGAVEFHMSAKKRIDGEMKYRKEGIEMGGTEIEEYCRWITDIDQVRKVSQILNVFNPS